MLFGMLDILNSVKVSNIGKLFTDSNVAVMAIFYQMPETTKNTKNGW